MAVEPRHCSSCGSANVSHLIGEIGLHFRGFENIKTPTLFVFPEVVVCMDCGLARFALGDRECRELVELGNDSSSAHNAEAASSV